MYNSGDNVATPNRWSIPSRLADNNDGVRAGIAEFSMSAAAPIEYTSTTLRIAAHGQRGFQPANERDDDQHQQHDRRQRRQRERAAGRSAEQIADAVFPRQQT